MRADRRAIAAVGDVVAGPGAGAQGHAPRPPSPPRRSAASPRPSTPARDPGRHLHRPRDRARSGSSEAQAREAGPRPVVATFPLRRLGRAPARWARARASPGSSPTPRPTASSASTSSARTPASSSAGGALAIELMAAPGDVAGDDPPAPDAQRGPARGGRADARPARCTSRGRGRRPEVCPCSARRGVVRGCAPWCTNRAFFATPLEPATSNVGPTPCRGGTTDVRPRPRAEGVACGARSAPGLRAGHRTRAAPPAPRPPLTPSPSVTLLGAAQRRERPWGWTTTLTRTRAEVLLRRAMCPGTRAGPADAA